MLNLIVFYVISKLKMGIKYVVFSHFFDKLSKTKSAEKKSNFN